MDQFVLGNQDCGYHDVVQTLVNLSTAATVYENSNWTSLVRKLIPNPGLFIVKLEQDVRLHSINLDEILMRILTEWRMKSGKDARLMSLINVFQDLKWKDFADTLKGKFQQGIKISDKQNLIKIQVRNTSKINQNSPNSVLLTSNSSLSDFNENFSDSRERQAVPAKNKLAHPMKCIKLFIGYSYAENAQVTNLDYNEYRENLEKIIAHQLVCEDSKYFQIQHTKLEKGKIVITCCNTSTVNWVVHNSHNVLNGMYRIYLHDDCPSHRSRTCFLTYLSGHIPTQSDLRKTLHFQNPKLSTDKWIVMHIGPNDGINNKNYQGIIKFSIPNELLAKLETINYTPFYLSGRMTRLEPASCC